MESDHGSDQGLGEGREGPQRDMVAPGSRPLWERIGVRFPKSVALRAGIHKKVLAF